MSRPCFAHFVCLVVLGIPCSCGARTSLDDWASELVRDASTEAEASNPVWQTCGPETVDVANNPSHCGRCNHDCLGGGCNNGVCLAVEIATSECAKDLAIDDSSIYWTDSCGNAILGISKKGGSRWTVSAGEEQPYALALDPSAPRLVWTNLSSGGQIRSAPRVGGAFYELYSGDLSMLGLAVDESYVYFSGWSAQGFVRRVRKNQPVTTTLITGQNFPGSRLILQDTTLWWANTGSGQIVRMGKDGSNPQVFLTSQSFPSSLELDATHLYWTNSNGESYACNSGDVRRSPKQGAQTLVIAPSESCAESLALDTTHVYWAVHSTTSSNGCANAALRRVAKAGGTAETVALTGGCVRRILVDDSAIYWIEERWLQNVGLLFRLAK